jgi:excisionase family DNA binding protein
MVAVTITQITYAELEYLMERTLKKLIKEYEQSNTTILDDKLWMTRQEVADMFGVTLATLNAWTKTKKINGYKLAGSTRVRYKKSEILDSLKDFNNQ